MAQEQQALDARDIARERWAQFQGERQIHVSELMFVKEGNDCWYDVAPVPLGRALLSPRK